MKWKTETFVKMMKDKLADAPIKSILLIDIKCSSVTLNEILSVLYFYMSEDGLTRLDFDSFP